MDFIIILWRLRCKDSPGQKSVFLQSFHDMRQSVKTLPELFTVQMYLLSRNLRLYESGNTDTEKAERAEAKVELWCRMRNRKYYYCFYKQPRVN